MPIYTKKGDGGKSSLLDSSKRLSKASLIFELLGSIDEVNSYLGVCSVMIPLGFKNKNKISRKIKDIQQDLMSISSIFAGASLDIQSLTVRVDKLEKEVDMMEKKLTNLTGFILPGGSRLSSHLMYARSLVRRSERVLVSFLNTQKSQIAGSKEIQKYINRLSDYLFVLARFVNKTTRNKEIVWNKK